MRIRWWDVRTPGAFLERFRFSRHGILTRKMVTIKKRAVVIPYIFSLSIAPPFSCSFYLLDLKTISSVDILEMT